MQGKLTSDGNAHRPPGEPRKTLLGRCSTRCPRLGNTHRHETHPTTTTRRLPSNAVSQAAPAGGWRVIILHSSPIVADALREGMRSRDNAVTVDAVHAWSDFARTWDFAPAWAVVDAYLDDHVPLALKVRSLVRERSGVVVLGTTYSPRLRERAFAEGAAAWLEPSGTLEAVVSAIGDLTAAHPDTRSSVTQMGTQLTDRELQLASLHASRRGLTPAAIGRSLGLAPATVKTHIAAARRKYRQN